MTTTTQARSQELAVAMRRLAVASDTVTDVTDQQADVLALILNRNEPPPPPPPPPEKLFAAVLKILTDLGVRPGQAIDAVVKAAPEAHRAYLQAGGGSL